MTIRKFFRAFAIAIGIAVVSIVVPIAIMLLVVIPQTAAERAQAPAAEVAPPGLTRANFLSLSTGMRYGEVETILGPGEEISRVEIAGTITVAYAWKTWTGANVIVMFQDGGLVSKTQAGL